MAKRIPIKALKSLASQYNLSHAILFCRDSERDHVVTYGKSIEDCSEAAEFGNLLKVTCGWPETLKCQPSRVTKLQKRIKELETENEQLRSKVNCCTPPDPRIPSISWGSEDT